MNIAVFLVAMVGPIMARALASLGLTLVSMAGLSAAVLALRASLMSSIGGLPLATLQLGGLYGLWECLAIGLSALTFCIAWNSTSGFWRLAKA